MGKSYRRLTAEQREAIFELKKARKTAPTVARICKQGYRDLPSFTVSKEHVNELYRRMSEERAELYQFAAAGLEPARATVALHREMVAIAAKETERLHRLQRKGRLDPRQLASLARATVEIDRLSERLPEKPPTPEPSTNGAEERSAGGWLDKVASSRRQDERPTAPVADIQVSEHGRALGRKPAAVDPEQADPTFTDGTPDAQASSEATHVRDATDEAQADLATSASDARHEAGTDSATSLRDAEAGGYAHGQAGEGGERIAD